METVRLSGSDYPSPRIRRKGKRLDYDPPVWIGHRALRARFGDFVDYGPVRSAKITVGLTKGDVEAERCRGFPLKIRPAQADAAFIAGRTLQLGDRKLVGATRATTKGWYKGGPEASVTYEVIYTGEEGPLEPDYATFKRHIDILAQLLANQLCQESVIVTHNVGGEAKAATFE